MDTNTWLLIAVSVIGIATLVGFFTTKIEGYGKFTTSIFLMLVVIIFTALFFAAGKIQVEFLSNILFAVIGYAGGLIVAKKNE